MDREVRLLKGDLNHHSKEFAPDQAILEQDARSHHGRAASQKDVSVQQLGVIRPES
jgi:hypothetical protein